MTSDSIELQIERALRAEGVLSRVDLNEVLPRYEGAGESVFLFGGDSTTIHALRGQVRQAFPRLRLAGVCDADFSGPAGRAILDHIAAGSPDVVIVDLPPRRHRALIAEFAAHGLRMSLVNLPGAFARSVATQMTGGAMQVRFGDAARFGIKLPRPIGRALAGFSAALRFSGIIARQLVQNAGPHPVSQAYHATRRDG